MVGLLLAMALVLAGCASPAPSTDNRTRDTADPAGEPASGSDGGTPDTQDRESPDADGEETVQSGGVPADLSYVVARMRYAVFHPSAPEPAFNQLSQEVLEAARGAYGDSVEVSLNDSEALEEEGGTGAVTLALLMNETMRGQVAEEEGPLADPPPMVLVVLTAPNQTLPNRTVLFCTDLDRGPLCEAYETDHDLNATRSLVRDLGPEVLRYEVDPMVLKDRFQERGRLTLRVPFLDEVTLTGKLSREETNVCRPANSTGENGTRGRSCETHVYWTSHPAVEGAEVYRTSLYISDGYLSATIQLPDHRFSISPEPGGDGNITLTVVGWEDAWSPPPGYESGPTPGEPEDRPNEHERQREPIGNYTFVWVNGTQRLDPEPEDEASCFTPFDHFVLPNDQRVGYNNSSYPFEPADLDRLFALDIRDLTTGCHLVDRLVVEQQRASAEVGPYGQFDLVYHGNATVEVVGEGWIASGENLTITYSERVTRDGRQHWANGTIRVDYLVWPRDQLKGLVI